MSLFPSEWVGDSPSPSRTPLGLQPLSGPLPALRLPRRWTASLPPGTASSCCPATSNLRACSRLAPGRAVHGAPSAPQRLPAQETHAPTLTQAVRLRHGHHVTPPNHPGQASGTVATWDVAGRPIRRTTADRAGRVSRPGGHATIPGARMRLFPWRSILRCARRRARDRSATPCRRVTNGERGSVKPAGTIRAAADGVESQPADRGVCFPLARAGERLLDLDGDGGLGVVGPHPTTGLTEAARNSTDHLSSRLAAEITPSRSADPSTGRPAPPSPGPP
jgi:hypothetical protein